MSCLPLLHCSLKSLIGLLLILTLLNLTSWVIFPDYIASAQGNNLQNSPVLISVTSSGGTTTIRGTLNSTASTQFRVNFFANSVCDQSARGEGQVPIGSTIVRTAANGNADFSFLTTAGAKQYYTATATDPNNNTSEFSRCFDLSSTTETATSGEIVPYRTYS